MHTSPPPYVRTFIYPLSFFFFNDTATTEIYTLSLHDALPIYAGRPGPDGAPALARHGLAGRGHRGIAGADGRASRAFRGSAAMAGGAGRGRRFRALAPAARPSGGQRAPVADLAAPGAGTCHARATARAGGCGIAGPCTPLSAGCRAAAPVLGQSAAGARSRDRKSTRLNSSHLVISYAVFCLKKKKNIIRTNHKKASKIWRHENIQLVGCQS